MLGMRDSLPSLTPPLANDHPKVRTMSAPLIDALVERHGLPLLDEAGLDAFVADGAHSLLFLAGDPIKYPEAVIWEAVMAVAIE